MLAYLRLRNTLSFLRTYLLTYMYLCHKAVWNSLSDYLLDPAVDSEQFRWVLFARHSKR